MKFSGVTILQGVEFSIFPIDYEWALQQCSATALPVITNCIRKCLQIMICLVKLFAFLSLFIVFVLFFLSTVLVNKDE